MFSFNLNQGNNSETSLLVKTNPPQIYYYVLNLINNYHISLKDLFININDLSENVFVSKEMFNTITESVYENIRLIYLFKLLIKKSIHKQVYKYPINEDLHFNKLSIYQENEIINVKDSLNHIYWSFYYKDIINIIKNSIINNEDNFPNPMIPRNPYTNQEFSIGNLYKIFNVIIKYDLPLELIIYYKKNFNI